MRDGLPNARRGHAAACVAAWLVAAAGVPATALVDPGQPPATLDHGAAPPLATSPRTPSHALVDLVRRADPPTQPRVRRVTPPPPPAPPAAAADQERADDSPTPGRVRTGTGGGTVSLTFDDGPSPTWTPRVLDLLDQYDARATFFLVGSQVVAHPDLARAIVARGHQVAGHTMDHRDLTGLPSSLWDRQVDQANALIERTTGQPVTCVRPPHGRHDGTVDARLGERGLDVAMWTLDPQDWARPGAEVIADRVLADLRPGAVVLLHDGGGDRSQTVAALERILASADSTTFAPMC